MSDNKHSTAQEVAELRVDVPDEYVDLVCDHIIHHVADGLVLEEEEEAGITGIIFYVPSEQLARTQEGIRKYIEQILDSSLYSIPEITYHVIQRDGWEEEYRKSVKLLRITDDIVVRPPWELLPTPVPFDIIIEPRMAFGTGSHETTRTCLKVIRERLLPDTRFLDLGCGSGILSILADKLKAGYIKAVDNDPDAVANCTDNFAVNAVQTPYNVVHGTVDVCSDDEPYDFVCANLIKNTILGIMPQLANLLKRGGTLVLSGLLQQDLAEVSARLEQQGLSVIEETADYEWFSVVVTKK